MLSSVTPFMDFPWALILNGAMSGIGFYAIRIVLLTVALKIILFPLDLFQRYKMRKNQLITVRIKPQLEKLEKAYGNDPKVLQQKQAELNKREQSNRRYCRTLSVCGDYGNKPFTVRKIRRQA